MIYTFFVIPTLAHVFGIAFSTFSNLVSMPSPLHTTDVNIKAIIFAQSELGMRLRQPFIQPGSRFLIHLRGRGFALFWIFIITCLLYVKDWLMRGKECDCSETKHTKVMSPYYPLIGQVSSFAVSTTS